MSIPALQCSQVSCKYAQYKVPGTHTRQSFLRSSAGNEVTRSVLCNLTKYNLEKHILRNR